MRAIGLSASRVAVATPASKSTAAPSAIDEELAAVTVPSLSKAGLRLAIFAGSQVGGISSSATTNELRRDCTSTGVTSDLKAPAPAAMARAIVPATYASCCARVKPYLRAVASAKV